MTNLLNLPELDHPADFGMTMHGWHFSQAEIRAALNAGKILNPAIELCTNYCPWNCDFCFTEKGFSKKKKALPNEFSLDEKRSLISTIAKMGGRSINIVGAGEPTIDPDFFDIIAAIKEAGMVAIVYTEGSLKLKDRGFCRELRDLDATVVLKVNSLIDKEYQNRILVSASPNRSTPKFDYFEKRAEALENLIGLGFNAPVPTRLAFDTIVCRENLGEMEDLHRYARRMNIFLLAVNFLPSGRSKNGHTNAITRDTQMKLFERLSQIDREEFGVTQRGIHPYGGAQPCTIRGAGAFIKIDGSVLACPGEVQPVGNIREEDFAVIWQRLADVRANFDGSCPPRERFWKALRQENYDQ